LRRFIFQRVVKSVTYRKEDRNIEIARSGWHTRLWGTRPR
jgi:hypothetical protein